ncbi:MAG: hypothetical protein ACD_43C00152G0001, partial [uncultured bacterium]
AAEQGPTAQVEALQTRLDTIVEANNNLEVAVDNTTREACIDYALDNPEELTADLATMEESLPKDDGPKTAEAAAAAKEMLKQVEGLSPEEAQGAVTKFCQENFGGSLADVARAFGEMVMPDCKVISAVMKGKMPKGRDVARLAAGMFGGGPIGTVTFDLIMAKGGDTPQEIKNAAIKGRLVAGGLKAFGFFFPEVAVVTTPAAAVMDNVSKSVAKTADQPNSTAADRAKAFGRGLIGSKDNLRAIADGLGGKMTDPRALEAAGITGDDAAAVKEIGQLIMADPDNAGEILGKAFDVSSGGIAGNPSEKPAVAI